MRFISLFLVLLLFTQTVFAAGKLQGADFKTEAELIAAGATKAQLLDDSKIYITANGINDKLSTAIANGQIGGGAGGSGGINVLSNESFEFGLTGWTNSGGTLSQQTYTNGSTGDTKYARFVATTVGQYFETTLKATPDAVVGGCLAKINYNTTDASNWKLQVYDSSSNLLVESNLTVKNWQDGYASFSCPSVGTQIKLRVISLAAGQIEGDKAYLGKENRTVNLSQYRLSSKTSYGAGTTTTGWRALSGTMSTVSSTSDVSHAGGFVTIKKTGTYFWISKPSYASTGNIGVGLSVNNVNPSGEGCIFATVTGDSGNRLCSGSASLVNGDVVKIAEYTASSIASTAGGLLELYYVPSGSDTALVPEAQDWFIDANIGGPSDVILSAASVTSYSETTNASLDMILNTGSAPAKIPCSTTNPATGLTCAAGSESVGVNFTNPAVGYYEVCVYAARYGSAGTSGTSQSIFQLIETTNSSQTIIQEGKGKGESLIAGTTTNLGASSSISHCGNFYFGSVSERTVRLMYEQFINGTAAAPSIPADRGATVGQHDIRITVKPFLYAYNRPYLTTLKQTAFAAYRGSLPYPGVSAALVFNTASVDTESTFNTSTGVYSSNKAGLYNCSYNVKFAHSGSTNQYVTTAMYKNGSPLVGDLQRVVTGLSSITSSHDYIFYLSKNDTIDVRVSGTTITGLTATSDGSTFNCSYIGDN